MPKKILLADDSITIQKVVELTFSDGDYEVTAVNNGAKAVQKLAEMRPDIILSDIIMPEKNGYEVCEYVKSHPDFRSIPVVLLTGTFEPFDPDRAEKAGCDAVVTKPFESQSLIHKVEELIAQAQSSSPAVAAAAEPEPEAEVPSPWMDDTPAAPPVETHPEVMPFGDGAAIAEMSAAEPFAHDANIFGAAATPQETTEMPFDVPAAAPFGGESASEETPAEAPAFANMGFGDYQTPVEEHAAPQTASASEPLPWEAPAEHESPFGQRTAPEAETRGFETPTFDAPPAASAFEAEPPAEPAPWDEPEVSPFTPPHTFPGVSPFGATVTPFDSQEPPPQSFGETNNYPNMSFEELKQMASTPAAEQESSPWGDEPALESEGPAFGSETQAFPKASFDEFQQSSQAAPSDEEAEQVGEAAPWDQPAPVEHLWSSTSETSSIETPSSESFSTEASVPFGQAEEATTERETSAFDQEAAEPAPFAEQPSFEEPATPEDLPFATETSEPSEEAAVAEQPSWSPVGVPEPSEPATPIVPFTPAAAHGAELTDEQVDRIARRVVELMSEQVVRNIAWEVIPDLAEMVVKERIRQLEAEA